VSGEKAVCVFRVVVTCGEFYDNVRLVGDCAVVCLCVARSTIVEFG
jgi:hypothetical protein